jgi:hypothetical protein
MKPFGAVLLAGLLLHSPLAFADGGCDLPAFAGARLFPAANGSQALAMADLDGDGNIDLVVVNNSGSVSILLGVSDGTFRPATNIPVRNPNSAVVADFNGDGKLDLAISDVGSSILFMAGNGDGTFQPAVTAARQTGTMAVGDFNGDGKPDLALVGTPAYIMLGNGNGTFQTPVPPPGAATAGFNVAVGDFNGDGKLDVVAGTTGAVLLMLGDGKGGLAAPVSIATSVSFAPDTLIVGDLNGDHKLDIVTVTGLANSVVVLMGNGNGTFQPPASYPIGDLGSGAVIADLNGDGVPDLAVANHASFSTPGTISVFNGNGDGTFQPAVQYNPTSQANWALGVADVNHDGLPDLIFTSIITNVPTQIGVMLGNPDGTLGAPRRYAAGELPRSPVLADLNGDGLLDIVAANAGVSGNLYVLIANQDGTFQPAVTYPAPFGVKSVAVGDLNGDGKPDIVAANLTGSNVLVYLNNGDGTFHSGPNAGTGFGAFYVGVGDFNNDGRLDVAVANIGGIQILFGNGDGTFRGGPSGFGICTGCTNGIFAISDVNGDGKLDIVVPHADLEMMSGLGKSGAITVMLGNGDGTFKAGVDYTIGVNAVSVAIGDMNGDGVPDILAVDFGNNPSQSTVVVTGAVAVLLGNGDGTFQAPVRYALPRSPAAVVVGDFDGDGINDVAVSSRTNHTITMFLGNGDGTLRNSLTYGAGGDPANMTIGDMNGDGKPDLVIVDAAGGALLTMMNTTVPGTAGSACTPVPSLSN